MSTFLASVRSLTALMKDLVLPSANKIEIKKAVEVAFGKKVASVRTANYDGKLKRQRRSDAGRTAHWKKAYVKLANGETLDLV